MVFQNPFSESSFSVSSSDSMALASPRERFLASLLDIVLLGPVIFFLIHPSVRQGYEFLLLGSSNQNLFLPGAVILLWAMTVTFLLQVTCLYFWQGTPGKRLTGLYVFTTHREPVSLGALCLRTLVWWGEVIVFGIPFLEVLIDSKGMSFHDRLAQTQVYSVKRQFWTVAPIERKFVHGIYGFILLLFVLFFARTMVKLQTEVQVQLQKRPANEESQVCVDAPHFEVKEEKSIDTWLAAFLTNQISSECLEEKAKNKIWASPQDAFSQLALGYLEQGEERKSYWDTLCQKPSEACEALKIIESGNYPENHDLSSMTSQVLHYFSEKQKGHYQKALVQLIPFSGRPSFTGFLAIEGVILSRLLGRDEMVNGILLTLPYNGRVEKNQDLFAQICYQDLHHSCRAQDSFSCQRMKNASVDQSNLSSSQALAIFKIQECAQEPLSHLITLSRRTKDVEISKFFAAMYLLKSAAKDLEKKGVEGMKDNALTDLDRLSQNLEVPIEWRKEALYQLAKNLNKGSDQILNRALRQWVDGATDLVWFSTGVQLLNKFDSKSINPLLPQAKKIFATRAGEIQNAFLASKTATRDRRPANHVPQDSVFGVQELAK